MAQHFLDPFICTEAQLLAIHASALALILQGKTLMSWSGEGVESGKEFVLPPSEILAECIWSLKSKNPQKYGYLSNSCRVFFY